LFHVEIQDHVFHENLINSIRQNTAQKLSISLNDTDYFVFAEKVENSAYNTNSVNINILYKNGDIVDIAQASDQLNISVLSKTVTKYFLCYPKGSH